MLGHIRYSQRCGAAAKCHPCRGDRGVFLEPNDPVAAFFLAIVQRDGPEVPLWL